MSVGVELRKFLLRFPEAIQPIQQIAEERIPESYTIDDGFVWFAVRNSSDAETLDPIELDGDEVPVQEVPDELFIDLEVYHPDKSVVQKFNRVLSGFNGYCGSFGNGGSSRVGALYVDGQRDDYVPTVGFDEDVDMSSSFFSIEIRMFKKEST